MKLVYIAYPDPDSWTQSEVQGFHNALRSQGDWFGFDLNKAWVHHRATDFDGEQRVWRGNRAVLGTADAIVSFLPTDWPSAHLPWEVGFGVAAGIPSIVVTSIPAEKFRNQPANCTIVTSANAAFGALVHVPPVFQEDTRMKAKWRHIDHDTRNDDLLVEPTRAHHDDAGFDLTYDGHHPLVIKPGESKDVPCGVAIEWPNRQWGLLIGRSSTFRNRGLLCNTAVIDPGYRGHLFACVRNVSHEEHTIQPGERVAQIVPLPALATRMDMVYVKELSETARGEKGFGSSGL